MKEEILNLDGNGFAEAVFSDLYSRAVGDGSLRARVETACLELAKAETISLQDPFRNLYGNIFQRMTMTTNLEGLEPTIVSTITFASEKEISEIAFMITDLALDLRRVLI